MGKREILLPKALIFKTAVSAVNNGSKPAITVLGN
jgi:hypothetical protein